MRKSVYSLSVLCRKKSSAHIKMSFVYRAAVNDRHMNEFVACNLKVGSIQRHYLHTHPRGVFAAFRVWQFKMFWYNFVVK